MCKNADTPCPGCKRRKTSDAAWMFLTDQERQALEASREVPNLAQARS